MIKNIFFAIPILIIVFVSIAYMVIETIKTPGLIIIPIFVFWTGAGINYWIKK